MSTFEQAAEVAVAIYDEDNSTVRTIKLLKRDGFVTGARYARDQIAEIIANFIPDMHEDDDACEDCAMVRSILKTIKELT